MANIPKITPEQTHSAFLVPTQTLAFYTRKKEKKRQAEQTHSGAPVLAIAQKELRRGRGGGGAQERPCTHPVPGSQRSILWPSKPRGSDCNPGPTVEDDLVRARDFPLSTGLRG